MDLSLTAEQSAVQQAFAGFFGKEATVERVRKAEPLGFDAELWKSLVDLGILSMAVPESFGGDGASAVDLMLVARECGRRLAPVPLCEATASIACLIDTESGREMLPDILSGGVLPTLAVRPVTGGVARLVPAGAVADLLIALDGDDLVAVRRKGPALESPANLAGAPWADWTIATDRQVLASGAAARQAHRRGLTVWRGLTAAALTGLGAQALEMAVGYVKTRTAFGVKIGSFQTIAHRLADVAAVADGVTLLVDEASWARDEDPDRAESLTLMAFLAAADSAFKICREALQFHGGYGYTLEYDIQLYFRRAKAWPLAIGPLRGQYGRLADLLFDARKEI